MKPGQLAFWVNSREQADAIIAALKGIAASYPDGQGEIDNR